MCQYSKPWREAEKQYKRYMTLGLRNGELVRIMARRGHNPDDIIRQTLLNVTPHPFLSDTGRNRRFGKLYLMTVGDEGTYGQSTNLKLERIVRSPPVPIPEYRLEPVDAVF